MKPSERNCVHTARSRFPRSRGAAITWMIVALFVMAALWWFRPWEVLNDSPETPRVEAPPRPVAARGSLAEDEQNNIAVFKAASPSVVHITTLETARSFFSLDIMQIPKGTGTGFMWDERGNVVTNFHVIQGANAATITLADQTTWKAA